MRLRFHNLPVSVETAQVQYFIIHPVRKKAPSLRPSKKHVAELSNGVHLSKSEMSQLSTHYNNLKQRTKQTKHRKINRRERKGRREKNRIKITRRSQQALR